MRVSEVPGAITQGSRPGSSRTAVEGVVVRRSSRSSRSTRTRSSPSMVTSSSCSSSWASQRRHVLPLRPESLAEPVVHPLRGRRAVGAEVRRDHRRPGLVEVGDAGPAGDAVEAQERGLAVPHRPQAHVALPGQRLEQGVVALGDEGAQVPVAAAPAERGDELRTGERPLGERPPHVLPEPRPVRRRQPVEALPAGQLPHPARGAHREVRARVLRRHQVGRAPERVDLDHVPCRQRPRRVTHSPVGTSGADRQLRRRLRPGGHRPQPPDHVRDRPGADRVEQVPSQPPRQRPRPRHGHHLRSTRSAR